MLLNAFRPSLNSPFIIIFIPHPLLEKGRWGFLSLSFPLFPFLSSSSTLLHDMSSPPHLCRRSAGFSQPVSLLIGTPWWRCPSSRRRIAGHTIKLPYSTFNRVTECISAEDDEQKRRVSTFIFLLMFLPARQSRYIKIRITCSTVVWAYVNVSLGENYVQRFCKE